MQQINNIRPYNLDDLIGLDDIKTTIKYDILGALQRNIKLPNYLISSPAGLGKTTIAHIISRMTGGEIHRIMGTDIGKPQDVYDLASLCKDNDTVFIEEAHGIGKKASTILLPWMEEGVLIGSGYSTTDAPRVIFIFPTTNAGKLSDPLRNRCRVLHINYYSLDDIKLIIKRAALIDGLEITNDDALTLLAQSSRGTPRTAIEQRLERVLNVMSVDNLEFNLATVKYVLKINGINEWGLESNDIKYCDTLYKIMCDTGGRPVSYNTIVQATGFSPDVVSNIIESYLNQLGVIRITSRGRIITELGFSVFQKERIEINMSEPSPIVSTSVVKTRTVRDTVVELVSKIDPNELKSRLANSEFSTMREVCNAYNIPYGPANPQLKTLIESLGYQIRRRAGIVKVN